MSAHAHPEAYGRESLATAAPGTGERATGFRVLDASETAPILPATAYVIPPGYRGRAWFSQCGPFDTDEQEDLMRHIDPVCGMEVDEKDAAGRSRYEEKDYYFCAPECKEAFDEDPTEFIENAP